MKKLVILFIVFFTTHGFLPGLNASSIVYLPDDCVDENNFIAEKAPIKGPSWYFEVEFIPGCRMGVHDGIPNCIQREGCHICYIKVRVGFGLKSIGTEFQGSPGTFLYREEGRLMMIIDKLHGDSQFKSFMLKDAPVEFNLSSESTLEFPVEVQKALHVPSQLVIQPGVYKVQQGERYYKIILE